MKILLIGALFDLVAALLGAAPSMWLTQLLHGQDLIPVELGYWPCVGALLLIGAAKLPYNVLEKIFEKVLE